MPILRPSEPSKPRVMGSLVVMVLLWSSMARSSGMVSQASEAAPIWLRKSAHISAGSLSVSQKSSAVRSMSTQPGEQAGSWMAHPRGSAEASP